MKLRKTLLVTNIGLSCAILAFVVLTYLYQGDRTISAIVTPMLVVCAASAAALTAKSNTWRMRLAIAGNLLILAVLIMVGAIAITGLGGLFGAVLVLLPVSILFILNWLCLRRLLGGVHSSS